MLYFMCGEYFEIVDFALFRSKKIKPLPQIFSMRGAVRRLGGLIPAFIINHSVIYRVAPCPDIRRLLFLLRLACLCVKLVNGRL